MAFMDQKLIMLRPSEFQIFFRHALALSSTEGASFVPFSQSLSTFPLVTKETSVSDPPIGCRIDQRSDLFTPLTFADKSLD